MAGISFIYEEYKKDPTRIEKLLDGKIEITEKLDGSRFLVQKDEGNRLLFFKRKDVPISKIDRTLSKYYEKALLHFETLSDAKIAQMPEGWRFGMEYFPNLSPVTIVYDRLPLNNLVLTDIQVKDPKDRSVDIITDKETLKKWSDIIEVENPPIIFEGKLDENQKKKLLDFLNTPYQDLITRFKTENFTSFILALLNPSLKSSFLNNDLKKDIDGLVFRFDGKEALRVSNPEVTTKKTKAVNEKPSDIYNLTLVFLQEFLTSLDFKKIKLKEKTFEERYIEFICYAYNKFLQTTVYKANFSSGVDFELPHFLTKAESEVNFNFVKDTETQRNLSLSSTNRELFKILLAAMRSHKRKPSGFFTKELIYYHNTLVDKIADFISSNVKESSFYSFDEFRSVYLTESEEWQDEFGKELQDDIEHHYIENINETEVSDIKFPSYDEVSGTKNYLEQLPEPEEEQPAMLVLKKLFTKDTTTKKKKNPICLMKGKFQFFHNGHDSAIRDAEAESKMKVFLVVMTKRLANSTKKELQIEMLNSIMKENTSIVGYVFSNGRTMTEIEKDIPSKYTVSAFAGSPEECEDIKKQMGDDFLTFPLTRHMSSKTVISKIRSEDYDSYKKLVPTSLHNYFYKLKNELND